MRRAPAQGYRHKGPPRRGYRRQTLRWGISGGPLLMVAVTRRARWILGSPRRKSPFGGMKSPQCTVSPFPPLGEAAAWLERPRCGRWSCGRTHSRASASLVAPVAVPRSRPSPVVRTVAPRARAPGPFAAQTDRFPRALRCAPRARAPSIYSTVPWRPRWSAALSASHGERRMRGRNHFHAGFSAEG